MDLVGQFHGDHQQAVDALMQKKAAGIETFRHPGSAG